MAELFAVRSRMRRLARRLSSLRALVLAINLLVLALPIVGIAVLRVPENFLHRQTEARLIAEATYIRALYIAAFAEIEASEPAAARALREVEMPTRRWEPEFDPVFPQIDLLFDSVFPPVAEPRLARSPASPASIAAGRQVEPIIRETQRQNLAGVRVLDPQGVVVATSGGELGCDFSSLPEVAAALQGRYASVVRERAKQPSRPGAFNRESRVRVHVALPIADGGRLYGVAYLSRTSLSLFGDAWSVEYTVALGAVLVLAIAMGLALGTFITRPLRDLVARARRIADGEKMDDLGVRRFSPREARDLAFALEAMLDALDRRLAFVREFTRGASHELKTPLASLTGAVELLENPDGEMTEAERRHFLSMMAKDVRRMDLVVRRLSELARIETRRPDNRTLELEGFLEAHLRAHRDGGRAISFESAGPCEVPLPEDLAEALFRNLIDNAFVHGGGKDVRVRLEAGPKVVVSDAGPGISESNLPKICDRFFTTARDKGGTGLGLSIAKAIAEGHGAKLTATSRPGRTEIVVDFSK